MRAYRMGDGRRHARRGVFWYKIKRGSVFLLFLIFFTLLFFSFSYSGHCNLMGCVCDFGILDACILNGLSKTQSSLNYNMAIFL